MNLRALRRPLALAAILLPAATLIALTWLVALYVTDAQRTAAEERASARVGNQAIAFAELINRQIRELDQTLRILVDVWQADPGGFNLEVWKRRTAALNDISRDMLLVSNQGRVIQSTVPEAVGLDVSSRDYFTFAVQHGRSDNDLFIGHANVGDVLRQWHMDVARWMRNADGSFAGVIVADWRVSAIASLFNATELGAHPVAELVGLGDGKLRAITGPAAGSPDDSIADTPMFDALVETPDGTWIGRSAPDGVLRVHAFRRIPGRDIAIVVGVSLADSLAPANIWARQAMAFAAAITVLIAVLAGVLLWSAARNRRRRRALAYDRSMLAAANAQLEIAKARADAKTAQLEATLNGMSDGVILVDARYCLVEWNRRFPEIAGLPPQFLRIGQPIEELLRYHAEAGVFGPGKPEEHVARQMAQIRSRRELSVMERQAADGRYLELRRNHLPDGGFVTLYSDVTSRKQGENALREAHALAQTATEARSRFVAIVSHEIRTPLSALLNTLSLLVDAGLSPPQRALLDMARQSGDALLGLINDILEMSRMEAGQLSLRPVTFALRPLLEGALEIFRTQAADRGMTLELALDPAVPRMLVADAGRVRQVLINLVSNAVKFGLPGIVTLAAGEHSDVAGRAWLRIAVRDRGPVIEEDGRLRLFQPFSRLDHGGEEEPLGTGLGLAICRHLAHLMGGDIGCDTWVSPDDASQNGNEFWVQLPMTLPPKGAAPSAPPQVTNEMDAMRRVPRTRILLVEDVIANQLVSATLLRREGHHVDVAGSGDVALQAITAQPYDLVFTDIFMPGMNGLDLARAIRSLPPPAGQMPIIALTANTAPEDQVLCRDAGMNRLIAKPPTLAALTEALADLAWPGLPARDATARVAWIALQVAPVLSSERLGELRSNLASDALGTLVEECLIDLQARLPALRNALEHTDLGEVVAQAHAMVGMAAGYGMAALEARLRALLSAAHGGDPARAVSLADDIGADLARAGAALREALAIEMV